VIADRPTQIISEARQFCRTNHLARQSFVAHLTFDQRGQKGGTPKLPKSSTSSKKYVSINYHTVTIIQDVLEF
jgi:hypothetical protein